MEEIKIIPLSDGRGIKWGKTEKPCINHWYRCISEDRDYWKILKDYHSPEKGVTYYKIVEYYNGDVLYVGKPLAVIRQIMRTNTFRMVI